jgi:hypothetical protein
VAICTLGPRRLLLDARRGKGKGMSCHYTTTPRLVMDDLTLKAEIAINDLSLKIYSDRLVHPV